MKKTFFLMIVTFILFTTSASISVAQKYDFDSKEPMSVDEVYQVKGYTKNVDKVINEFEKKIDKDISIISIPQKIPFEVTKRFAKIEKESNLSIHYLGEDRKDIFQYTVNTENLRDVENNNKLSNGKEVFIDTVKPNKIHSILELVYKHQDIEYIMSIKINEKYTKENLMETAESLK
ncbi:hypothetical protein ACDX78_13130 [Virgibacillus oceani]